MSSKAKGWVTAFLVALFVLPFVVNEVVQPSLSLAVIDRIEGRAAPVTAPMDYAVEARLYSTTAPYQGRIATLQKGLVLFRHGKSLVGEGYGIGLPIVHKDGTAYLPATSRIGRFSRGDTLILSKVFYYDRRETDSDLPRFRYVRCLPLTRVRVDYFVYRNRIDIMVDLKEALERGIDEVFLMNEVSGRLFQVAVTGNGQKLDLLHWQLAPLGSVALLAPDAGLLLWVECDGIWDRFLGREVTSRWKWYGHVNHDWTGCEIHLDRPLSRFHYSVRLQSTSLTTTHH